MKPIFSRILSCWFSLKCSLKKKDYCLATRCLEQDFDCRYFTQTTCTSQSPGDENRRLPRCNTPGAALCYGVSRP